ncbi:Putative sensory transduction regulator [Solimonas aquatica]|uniref:Putative sensory transduction regulator n=1 Tax=Solimonas aquatica TaxID=489703 RepID=A0A1H9DP10_9GAMM|nr:YbjN domain-containing protein [Solimonas aquatica]SEQ14483.1 Putative sensory transduction regulator [Solimonas aquatica]
MNTPVASLSLAEIADVLRGAGLRATLAEQQDGRQLIQSAVQGIGFVVTGGNCAPQQQDRYVDLSFSCLIATDGGLDAAMAQRWNAGKRFARMYHSGEMLVVAMDVFIAAGEPAALLRAYCELWDRVLHEFIAFVRSMPAAPAAKSA